jgi:hypothetical protein
MRKIGKEIRTYWEMHEASQVPPAFALGLWISVHCAGIKINKKKGVHVNNYTSNYMIIDLTGVINDRISQGQILCLVRI